MGKLSALAGLIGHNPSPGIYSRLERAVEDMPATVQVKELPGLIKRYKEGVPGWEVREVFTPDLTEGVQSIPRQDLLDAVKERSPVYTHKEVVLGGRPPTQFQPEYYVGETPSLNGDVVPAYQRSSSPIGLGISHGAPKYAEYGQGGKDYAELLLLQPTPVPGEYGNHWSHIGQPYSDVRATAHNRAVAHARYDTHGDALRINELQSDLGIHNRKMREQYAEYQRMMRERGREPGPMEFQADQPLPFPLEDAWAELLIKRLALEAARKGHRAIEVASPRAIADKVGGNIDNYEHFYGKVVPGALERLGRKMGGLTPDAFDAPPPSSAVEGLKSEFLDIAREISAEVPARARDHFDRLVNDLRLGNSVWASQRAEQVAKAIDAAGISDPGAMPRIMSLAQRRANVLDAGMSAGDAAAQIPARSAPPGRRYIMSDAMRRRILEGGIGAAVAAPVLGDDELIERLDQ